MCVVLPLLREIMYVAFFWLQACSVIIFLIKGEAKEGCYLEFFLQTTIQVEKNG